MRDVLPQNRSQLHSKGLGTLCSWVGTWKRYHDSRYHIRKVYHSFLLKMVYKRWGVGPQGEVSPYKSLLTTPPPLPEGGREGRSHRWVCRWNPKWDNSNEWCAAVPPCVAVYDAVYDPMVMLCILCKGFKLSRLDKIIVLQLKWGVPSSTVRLSYSLHNSFDELFELALSLVLPVVETLHHRQQTSFSSCYPCGSAGLWTCNAINKQGKWA